MTKPMTVAEAKAALKAAEEAQKAARAEQVKAEIAAKRAASNERHLAIQEAEIEKLRKAGVDVSKIVRLTGDQLREAANRAYNAKRAERKGK